jgi:hypothetical protein
MAIGKARKIAKYVEDPTVKEGYRFVPTDTVSLKYLNIL